MSNEEKQWLKRIEAKIDRLLSQNIDASQKPNDVPEPSPAPRKRQAKVKPVDFKTMYRKKGIV
jgi:hypothetical protein